MADIPIAITILLVGIALSAIYSGLETGLYTINQIRLHVRATSKQRSAKRLQRLIENPTRMLAVLLICNNVANYVASYGAARLLQEASLGPWISILLNALVMIPLLFIFGEVLPKDLFRTRTDSWTYRCSTTLSISDQVLRWTGIVPVVSTIGRIAQTILGKESTLEPTPRRRFGLLFKEGLDGGVLSDEQITLADRVLTMQSLTVKSKMTPWARVSCIDETMSLQRRAKTLCGTKYTRIPVLNRNGRVEGILPVLRALLEPEMPTNILLLEPLNISPDTKVQDALHQLRESGKSIGVVAHSGKQPLGIVTLKDLVEPIVGELSAW